MNTITRLAITAAAFLLLALPTVSPADTEAEALFHFLRAEKQTLYEVFMLKGTLLQQHEKGRVEPEQVICYAENMIAYIDSIPDKLLGELLTEEAQLFNALLKIQQQKAQQLCMGGCVEGQPCMGSQK